jgi:hypothetical protein
MNQAALQGRSLFDLLLRDTAADITETSFLAASVTQLSILYFSVPNPQINKGGWFNLKNIGTNRNLFALISTAGLFACF